MYTIINTKRAPTDHEAMKNFELNTKSGGERESIVENNTIHFMCMCI